jgi:hypothetical protein
VRFLRVTLCLFLFGLLLSAAPKTVDVDKFYTDFCEWVEAPKPPFRIYDFDFILTGKASRIEMHPSPEADVHVFLHTGDTDGVMLSVPRRYFKLEDMYQDAVVKVKVHQFDALSSYWKTPDGNIHVSIWAFSFSVEEEP